MAGEALIPAALIAGMFSASAGLHYGMDLVMANDRWRGHPRRTRQDPWIAKSDERDKRLKEWYKKEQLNKPLPPGVQGNITWRPGVKD